MKKYHVKSSKDAIERSHTLPSYWSNETLLTQRILIYACQLLEQLVNKRKNRKPSAWQRHVSEALRQGKTIKEAAKSWKGKS